MKSWTGARLAGIASGAGIAVSLFAASAGYAESLRSAAYRRDSRVAADHAYRLEYDGAIEAFTELEKEYPTHPGPPLARSVAVVLKELVARDDLDLERFISPGYFTRAPENEMPEADRTLFFDGIERSRALATRHLEAHPGNTDARYYLGACEGALGVFALTIDHSFRQALKHGKESYRIQLSVIEDDPDFMDAYMTVGTYEYVVDNLPWYIKWIATLAGYTGSEARGFEYIARAAEDGFFVKDDARVLLMVLYVREKEYDYAIEMARQLHRRFPENYILHLNQAQILERMGRKGEAAQAYAAVARHAARGAPNYQLLPLGKIRYPLGQRLLSLGDSEEALDQFRDAALDPATPERERALSHLKAGEILDGLGRRDEALVHYREVTRFDDVEGSHGVAHEYIRNYAPEDR